MCLCVAAHGCVLDDRGDPFVFDGHASRHPISRIRHHEVVSCE